MESLIARALSKGAGVFQHSNTAVLGNLAIFCGRQTKCAHASKYKAYAAPLNFSICTHASFTVGDFNFARLTKTAVYQSIVAVI